MLLRTVLAACRYGDGIITFRKERSLENSRTLVLKVGFSDGEHQHHLGTREDYQFLDPT